MRSIKSRCERYAVRSDVCDRYTKDEYITVADFCNLFFRLVFTHNLVGHFNQVCHDLIELRDVF